MMSLLSLFLLKFHEFLHGSIGVRLKALVSLSTLSWRRHLRWLGHSQNSMKLLLHLLKKLQSSNRIVVDMIWNEWFKGSKIFRAAWMELVMTIILKILSKRVAWLMPHLIANNLALVLVTLTAWCIVLVKGLLTI